MTPAGGQEGSGGDVQTSPSTPPSAHECDREDMDHSATCSTGEKCDTCSLDVSKSGKHGFAQQSIQVWQTCLKVNNDLLDFTALTQGVCSVISRVVLDS